MCQMAAKKMIRIKIKDKGTDTNIGSIYLSV